MRVPKLYGFKSIMQTQPQVADGNIDEDVFGGPLVKGWESGTLKFILYDMTMMKKPTLSMNMNAMVAEPKENDKWTDEDTSYSGIAQLYPPGGIKISPIWMRGRV